MTEVTNADVTPEDRELLAKEYEREGSPMTAFRVRHGNEWPWERTALRAIPAARQQERERVLASQMADRDSRPTRVAWHPVSETPPCSITPYHSYLVWLRSDTGPISSGIATVARFSRDRQAWEPDRLMGLVLTHWAEFPRPDEAGPEFPWREAHREKPADTREASGRGRWGRGDDDRARQLVLERLLVGGRWGRGDDDRAPGPWERELAAIVDESERDARFKAIGKALRLLRSRIPGGPADWTEFDEALREIG